MLTDGIAAGCRARVGRLESIAGVTKLVGAESDGRSAKPSHFEATSETWRSNETLAEEVFGPVGVIVRTSSADEFNKLATSLEGQLTATLHIDEADDELAAGLIPILERKAGRLLANG